MPPQQGGANREANRTQRDQAGLNFTFGEKAGQKTARTNPDGGGRLQPACLNGITEIHDILGVDDDDQLDERGNAEKVGVPDQRQPERPVAVHDLHLVPDIGEEVCAEVFGGVGGGNAGDLPAGGHPNECQYHQNEAGPSGCRGKNSAENPPGHGAANDGDERAEFENAVTPGQLFFRQQFRQNPIFRGTEDGAVQAHEKHAENGQVKSVPGKAGTRPATSQKPQTF